MKNRSFVTLGILELLVAASAFGQQKLRADIPFEFHFKDMVMPAGQYDVDTDANNIRGLLSFSCYACQARAYAVTIPIGGGTEVPSEGRVVFNRYGDTYFFAEVWVPGRAQGGTLGKSKTELELERNAPSVSRVTLPGRVIIARR